MPDAFALPNGQIVVLDCLVELAETPDEIDSVLLHEIGHVKPRHGVRTLLQSRVIALITTLASGFASGLSELTSQRGSQLLRSAYSRDVEREADAFAFDALAASERDPAAFAAIIRTLAGEGETVRHCSGY